MAVVIGDDLVTGAFGLSVGERLWLWESVARFEELGEEPVGLSPAAQGLFDSARGGLRRSACDVDLKESERKEVSPLPSSPLNNPLLPIPTSRKERERKNPRKNIRGSSSGKTPGKRDPNRELRQQAVAYLNQATGRGFSDSTAETVRMVNARAAEGHGIDDFMAVIDNRVREWGDDPRMREYLRPSTLFRASRFPEYLAIAREEEHGGEPDDASRWAAYGSVIATYGEADRG
jgi:uncharacterized phage protein (TIGR02220 family)